MSEPRQDYDARAVSIQRELQTVLTEHNAQLLPVAVSPSGAPVPLADFLPERWRVEIRIIEAQ